MATDRNGQEPNAGAEFAATGDATKDFKNSNQDPSTQSGETSPDIFAELDAKQSPSKLRFGRTHTNAAQTCCAGKTRLVCCLMGTILIFAIALLVATFTFNLFGIVNEPDRCIDQSLLWMGENDQTKQFSMFATKTIYHRAREQLGRSRKQASNSVLFNKTDLRSFDELILDLVGREKCEPKQFHYFGRHATRWPSKDDLARIVANMDIVKNRINDLLKHTKTNHRSANQTSTPIMNTTTKQNDHADVCYDPLVRYGQWQASTLLGSQLTANLITPTGVEETQAIASRFKKLFPNLFDKSKVSDLDFGVTSELRTAQTALVFMKHIDQFKLDSTSCNLNNTNDFPSFIPDDSSSSGQGYASRTQPAFATTPDSFPNETRGSNNLSIAKASELATKITSSTCFQKLQEKFGKQQLLSFHRECNNYLQPSNNPAKIDHKLDIDADRRIEHIAKSVSKKLKLNDHQSLTSNQTRSIYDVCRYETAISGRYSIWCTLFSEADLKYLEFLADVKDFYNSAYGHRGLAESACVIGSKLFMSLKRPENVESKFYFTHSEVLQRLIALSTDLSAGLGVRTKDEVMRLLDSHKVLDERGWRTSLLTPFSANLAFTVLKCPLKKSSSGIPVVDIGDEVSPFKVIATLNEQPIVLDGCLGPICDTERLLHYTRLMKDKRCTDPRNYCVPINSIA